MEQIKQKNYIENKKNNSILKSQLKEISSQIEQVLNLQEAKKKEVNFEDSSVKIDIQSYTQFQSVIDKKKNSISNLIDIIKNDDNAASNIKKENEKNQDILYIPPHQNLCNAITKSFDKNNELKINLSKKDIEAMTKIGIITHSFDSNWIPQINYQENISNEDMNINVNENNKKPSKAGMKKTSSLGSMATTFAGSQKVFNNIE